MGFGMPRDWMPVSIHAPAKGATSGAIPTAAAQRRFDPRPREGGDSPIQTASGWSCTFRSTPPRRGRPGPVADRADQRPVSIHAPAKGATQEPGENAVDDRVSIHAPAKGATPNPVAGGRRKAVSIHAPAKGATRFVRPAPGRRSRFDPRPREGGDGRDRAGGLRAPAVSIHAPAKGATVGGPGARQPRASFDPRPREGGDDGCILRHSAVCGFDPRPREGGDR